ncbi:hypothetical protein NLJ89_g11062 [Agrocybe chaxingu]|uniref:Galactose-1-phosphate uridylyltransferase n=1 Tax=Agrocybe chaxingu TaxID=84603 RepID=A0A9W8JMK7_9AGAR|nr:hypothetical protein NLJ89_g11062 [Agrocybe chaxingu]
MDSFDPTFHPHRRFNPLTDDFVLVSPHRTKRPWLGQTETPEAAKLPKYDEKCYLCPGNARASGQRNPQYTKTFSFDNDFAALLSAPAPLAPTPVHPLIMPQLSTKDIEAIIEEWIRIYEARGSQTGIRYVQIFENKGSTMGGSNPHPHGQIWSQSAVPSIPAKELKSLKRYAHINYESASATKAPEGRPCLLCEYAHVEVNQPRDEGRVVVLNDHWVALVPWWAIWPFEILLLPYRRHIDSISDLDAPEKQAFADILSRITRRYDNLFSCSFAYSMGIHQRPIPKKQVDATGDDDDNYAHLHLHFEPPLLRSASVRKFLVGFELMAEPQRDLTPEQAAMKLRQCSEVHYLEGT